MARQSSKKWLPQRDTTCRSTSLSHTTNATEYNRAKEPTNKTKTTRTSGPRRTVCRCRCCSLPCVVVAGGAAATTQLFQPVWCIPMSCMRATMDSVTCLVGVGPLLCCRGVHVLLLTNVIVCLPLLRLLVLADDVSEGRAVSLLSPGSLSSFWSSIHASSCSACTMSSLCSCCSLLPRV